MIPKDRKDWVLLTKTSGKFEADIIAGELNAFGVPAWSWQEGAGQALGLTVGILGEGRVLVPADRLQEAQTFLDELEPLEPLNPDEWEEEFGD